jgi:hypothetical protein
MKFILFLALVFSAPAFAFTLNSSTNSNFKGWANSEISFQVNASNCPAGMDVAGLMNKAFEVWNNVATSRVHLSLAPVTSSTTISSPTTVYCETNFAAVTGADENYVPAGAAILPSGDYATNGIFYLNVSTGQANISRFDQDKLLVILAHEVGHILGLGHSHDATALMYYNASAKTELNLGQDDVDGVTYLYPRSEATGEKPFGCALVAAPKPPTAGLMIAVVLCLLVPIGVAVRLRI